MLTLRQASVPQRVSGVFLPMMLLLMITGTGLGSAVKKQILQPSLTGILSPKRWWNLIFETGFPAILALSDKMWSKEKASVASQAYGVVLEVGPGAGHTVAYYDASKITKITGVEPYTPLHPQLRRAVASAQLTDKYDILGISIEDETALAAHGITEGSLDTIVCVQVLCSIPDPQSIIARMYRLLKPGGQLLVFEHIQSRDNLTRRFQQMWTHGGWHALTGCNFDRPTDDWLQTAGKWESVEFSNGPNETAADVVPHAFGRMVKA